MEQVRQEQKPEISPRVVFLARLIYWLLLLAIPVVTLAFFWYGGLLCYIAAQTFYYFWMQKRGIFVVNDTNLAWWRKTWIYQYFYLPTIDESIEHRKRLKVYLILGILCIFFGMEFFYLSFVSTLYDLKDMVVIQGSYVGNQKLPQKSCAHYLLTFRRDDGSPVQLLSSLSSETNMIMALEEGMKSNERYTIWGKPRNYSLMPECRKFLSLAQIVGPKYKLMFKRDYQFFVGIKAIGVCLLLIGIIMLKEIVMAGKMLKNSKKLTET